MSASVRRLEQGNFGAAKVLQDGVLELRLDFGPGYRVYFGREGHMIIILPGGGSKRRQNADIASAVERWNWLFLEERLRWIKLEGESIAFRVGEGFGELLCANWGRRSLMAGRLC